MRFLKYFALLSVLMLPLAHSQAQVGIAVGIGGGPGYLYGPPACSYGYYDYYPYACAPYGYYGPSYFVNGIFIGAGPWYHGGWGRGFYGPRRFVGRGFYGRPGYFAHGAYGRGYGRGYSRGEFHGNAFHGGGGYHGGGFHGGGRRR